MKNIVKNSSRAKGSVLIVTLSVVAVAAIVLASYFMMVQNQSAAVARSQTWNSVIPVSEAGIEEGLAMVNIGAPNIIPSQWGWVGSLTTNGWSAMVNGQTTITRSNVLGSYTYTVTVVTNSGTPVITSTASVSYNSVPWIFASQPVPFLAAGGAQVSSAPANIGRKVQVQTVLIPLFGAAVLTKSNFNMNGQNVTVDSYDSTSFLNSTLGQYDLLKRKAGGDVATDSSIVGDVGLGNGNIYGHVMTGPGTQQNAVQVGPNGAVGDVLWNATGSGVQGGYWSGDFNVNIPDVGAPGMAGALTSLPAPDVNGVVNLSSGSYTLLPGAANINKPLNITGPVTIWVQGSYSPAGLTIASSNSAKLVLYVGTIAGSDSMTLGGNQALNQPGYPVNFQVYGLPSLTSISMHGNAGFEGTIYAPEADATFGGGGNSTADTSGSIVAKSMTMSGHWNFHYDENLKVNGPNRGWVAKNWTELKFP